MLLLETHVAFNPFLPNTDTAVLDDLVDKTWTRLQQVLAVKEPVALKVKSDGQEYVCVTLIFLWR